MAWPVVCITSPSRISITGGASLKFTGYGGVAIAELYNNALIGKKVVLNLMDGLAAQYAGGPQSQPNYAVHHATLLASKDPVAIDAIALQRIEPMAGEGQTSSDRSIGGSCADRRADRDWQCGSRAHRSQERRPVKSFARLIVCADRFFVRFRVPFIFRFAFCRRRSAIRSRSPIFWPERPTRSRTHRRRRRSCAWNRSETWRPRFKATRRLRQRLTSANLSPHFKATRRSVP